MKIVVFSYDAERVPFYYSGTMNAAAEGTPTQRIDDKNLKKNFLAPLCLGEALRRVSIVFWRFYMVPV